MSDVLKDRHAAIIGGGITGLAAARVMSDRGARVTLLERDAEAPAGTPEEAFTQWKRPGAPQVRHSHAFLGRLRKLLRERYPDVLDALLAAGASELRMTDRPPRTLGDLAPEPGDEELVALGCRRTTFEWVLRNLVLARSGVTLVSGASVRGLVAAAGEQPRIAGIRYEAATRTSSGWSGNPMNAAAREETNQELGMKVHRQEKELAADIVIDASGRGSRAAEWLASIGAPAPKEKLEQSGIVYYTRFYRLLPGANQPPPNEHPAAADFNWVKYAVFPADDRTFSVTLAVPLAVPRLKVLAKVEAFDAMIRSIPAVAPWVAADVAEPIGDPHRPVQAMGGLINRLRRFVVHGEPVALGFFVLGDAAYCTNPLYGRGCAQAFLHADLLGQAIDAHAGDLRETALTLDRLARAEIEPFYRASVLADRDSVRRAEGRKPRNLAGRLSQKFFEDGVAPATRCDPVVFRAFLRMFNMLDTPERAFGRPEVLLRSLWVLLRGRRYNRRFALPDPPDRDEVIARCEAAAGR